MLPMQNDKTVVLAHGLATVASGATASAAVLDTFGYDVATVEVSHPPATATNSSAKLAAFAIYESDATTFATTYPVAVGTTNATAASGQFVLGEHNNTTYGAVARVTIPLQGRRRYLFVVTQPPATTNYNHIHVVGRLSRAEQAPIVASAAGVTTLHVV